jgi:hypothetical protein
MEAVLSVNSLTISATVLLCTGFFGCGFLILRRLIAKKLNSYKSKK